MEAAMSTTDKIEVPVTIGGFIRQRRVSLGMTQVELCQKLGKHQVWASTRECGHNPVRSEEVPALAEALQVDVAELQAKLGTQTVPALLKATPVAGIVTKDVVTTEVLRWQVGDRSVPIDELDRGDLLDAVRSLFDVTGRLRAECEKEMEEMADAYEQKIHSLHHALAAQAELEIREAVRDKMDAILEAVMAEVQRREATASNSNQKETSNGH